MFEGQSGINAVLNNAMGFGLGQTLSITALKDDFITFLSEAINTFFGIGGYVIE